MFLSRKTDLGRKPKEEKNFLTGKTTDKGYPGGMRKTGTVIFFSDFKGYGFIRSDTGEELFVGISSIIDEVGNGYSNLKTGDKVTFAKIPPKKEGQKFQAVNVTRVTKTED